ncbi:helix-turn-helix domain-containing protein [Patescibacteria group bacterium]
MKKYQALKKQLLKNKKIKAEYDLLEPEFALKEKLIKLRIKAHLTQAELAQKMGTKQSSIARFEKQLVNPTLSFLTRLGQALGKKLVVDFR